MRKRNWYYEPIQMHLPIYVPAFDDYETLIDDEGFEEHNYRALEETGNSECTFGHTIEMS